MNDSTSRPPSRHPAHLAMLDVVEALSAEQLTLVARWLGLEAKYLEYDCDITNPLPDISELLKLCAKSKGQVSYAFFEKQMKANEQG